LFEGMILTCPACSARYLIAGDAIGEQGRDVRCGKCGHNWTQEPVHDSLDELSKRESEASDRPAAGRNSLDDAVESFLNDEIPEGVKPIPEPEAAVSFEKRPVSKKPPRPQEEPGVLSKNRPLVAGLAIGLAVFSVLAYGLVAARASIISIAPATKPVFVMLGFEQKSDAKTLVFDSVTAKMENGTLLVTGSLINLSANMMVLPQMVIDILDAAGKPIKILDANIEQKSLNGEQSLELNFSFDDIPAEGEQARLRFAGGNYDDSKVQDEKSIEEPTTAAEDADNIPALPEAEIDR
jgi:predicted Zn finger-like uncharacterized protein